MLRKIFTIAAVTTIGLGSAAYAASFADIDANGDGAISQDEFAAAYPDAGADAWTAADANGDGSVTQDELTAAMESGVVPQ